MEQISCSVRLKHSRQGRQRLLASRSADEKTRTSSGDRFNRWKAIRTAERGPTPGNLPSSWIRRSKLAGYSLTV